MGRSKINPGYDPIKARNELVQAVNEMYLHPSSPFVMDKDGHTRMKDMMETFGLSAVKIRKLLVTGGNYHFYKKLKDGRSVDMVEEVKKRMDEGKDVTDISKELGVSRGTVTSFMPYKSGTYNADFTVDGYDFSNVSVDARRKRNQRKREKMKDKEIMDEKKQRLKNAEEKRNAFRQSQESLNEDRINALLEKHTFLINKKHNYLLRKVITSVAENEIIQCDKTNCFGVIDENNRRHYFTVFRYKLEESAPFIMLQAAEIHPANQRNGKLVLSKSDSGTDYEFSITVSKKEQDQAFRKLLIKTVVSLTNQVIGTDGYAKETGTIHIKDDENGENYFSIDGKRCTPDEVLQYFSVYTGFDLNFQIVDPAAFNAIEKDMVLMPVRLNQASFTDELNDLLYTLTENHEGKYLSKKDVPVFDVMFGKITDKYEYYCTYSMQSMGRITDSVKETGRKMIEILKGVGTDDDLFPAYEVNMIETILKE